jgi:hypothetical protein
MNCHRLVSWASLTLFVMGCGSSGTVGGSAGNGTGAGPQ